MLKIYAVIVAGGTGSRMGAGKNKILLEFAGQAVLRRTVEVFCRCDCIDGIVVVTRKEDREECEFVLDDVQKNIQYADGGNTRQQSVYNGLKMCTDADYVLIHDAARAMIDEKTINAVTEDCIKYGGAAVGVKCKDTLKTVDENGFITGTVDREYTYNIQTPQAFLYSDILRAHEKADTDGIKATDDCALMEYYGKRIKLTEGNYENIKLTTPDDMAVGEMILRKRHKGGVI